MIALQIVGAIVADLLNAFGHRLEDLATHLGEGQ